ncbi:OLC1v1026328C1 [Oldenlandia corymbosa var. corymbosa]|uniref:OLC1v1026328C1 n=1 Tax=Oldenlandia corymbosa var. corymbosa TaxID=529605 RepID=A0AAV1C6V2_OLDCO|nr:OLC1v1026328C1 [Oldenlandia corymbosa var. corymbosa]
MEAILNSTPSIPPIPTAFLNKIFRNPSQIAPSSIPLRLITSFKDTIFFALSSSSSSSAYAGFSFSSKPRAGTLYLTSTTSASLPLTSGSARTGHHRHWMVLVEDPPQQLNSKPQIIDFYVKTLERVVGSETDAQMCIYDASCSTNFGFCCDIDEEAADELARLPGVISVKPDLDLSSKSKNYSRSEAQSNTSASSYHDSPFLFPPGTSKHWIVRVEKPPTVLITKVQIIDYYTRFLTKVLGNESDAQMCIYHVSTLFNYGFCCELDDACAQELAGVPGVLSVHPDANFESDDKDYRGENLNSSNLQDSASPNQVPNVQTKKLFVTGLSFYTSEKTLRAAFEGFGELVEVKVIMDKISKRSKGYAFVEYTTEEAAGTALREMNGKIINGWMITVDVAKTRPPRYSRGQPRAAT